MKPLLLLAALLLSAVPAQATVLWPDPSCPLICHWEEVPYVPSLGPPRPIEEYVLDNHAPETVTELVCAPLTPIHPPVEPPSVQTAEAGAGVLFVVALAVWPVLMRKPHATAKDRER